MSKLLPSRLKRESSTARSERSCPAHRAWVRRHQCCVPGCIGRPIECAHVRRGTDGGVALKPSDGWTISLCRSHHEEQHRIGEPAFEQRYGIDLVSLASTFARLSPHRERLARASVSERILLPAPRHGRSVAMTEPALRQLLSLLSVGIGAIMEDESAEAVSALPDNPEKRFLRLRAAGQDITALAEAALVVLHRGPAI